MAQPPLNMLSPHPPVPAASKRNPLLLLLGLVAAVYLPILFRMGEVYDFVVHGELAQAMLQFGTLQTPHFLYQLLLAATVTLIPGLGISWATVAVTTTSALALAWIAYGWYCRSDLSPRQAAALTCALLLAAPVPLLGPLDGHLYQGYIHPSVYHNPTILLLKPIGLALFICLTNQLTRSAGAREALLLALLTFLSALAKPSLIICLPPALLLLAILRRSENPPVPIWQLSIGLLLPAAAILGWQYLTTFSNQQTAGLYAGESHIIFAPLLVMGTYSAYLLPKFLLSMLFPLAVTYALRHQLRHDPALQLAWLAFGCGAGYTYLLAESGPRLLQGNFTWSGQITLFILFAVTLLRYGQTAALHHQSRELKTCRLLLYLHVISGALYYAAEIFSPEKFW